MAMRDGAETTLAHQAATMVAGHLGVQTGFINKHQPADIPAGLLPAPKPPGGFNVRPILLGGRVVFFIAQTELFQPVPQSGDANGNFQLLQTTFLEFAQSQIRLCCNPPAQGSVMLFQARTPVSANLFGRHSPVRRCWFQKRSTLLRLTPKRRQTSPVPSPRSRAAMIRCRKS